MTKKDFEILAAALAQVEEAVETIDNSEKNELQIGEDRGLLYFTVDTIASKIALTHPRFKKGVFEIAALPIKNERLKQSILANLAKDES